MLLINYLEDDGIERWNAYVNQHPEATFFHLAQWKGVLESAFGHKTYFLLAEDETGVLGVLPLAQVKSLLFGNSLVSTPFCVYGGVLADSDEIHEALINRACDLADDLGVDYLEIRNRTQKNKDWPYKPLYYTFRKEIADNEEDNLKAIPRKQRAVVRKSLVQDLDATFGSDLDRFYTAYSTSVRNLGTPVFSKKYFKLLLEAFPEQSDTLTITKDDTLVASVMNFYFRDEVLPYYGGGTEHARNLKGNDFMYWELMCESIKRGLKVFNYGRSKEGTGSFSYKKNWGFEPQPLFYEYYLVKATEVPDINPLNPKYQLMIKTWKKLPLAVSQIIGPLVSKYLG